MDSQTLYRVMLVVSSEQALEQWVHLAAMISPAPREIHLRGLVTIPAGTSLSEGANAARALREGFARILRTKTFVDPGTQVIVDYQPMSHVLDELVAGDFDLLLVQWAGPVAETGGLATNEILQRAPSEVVLLDALPPVADTPVLLSLRGGTNIALGLRTATALAGEGAITLFHATESTRYLPNLGYLMNLEPRITRIVNISGNVAGGIIQESKQHGVIIMGATFYKSMFSASGSNPLTQLVYENVDIPLALIRTQVPQESSFRQAPTLTSSPDLSTRVDRWFAQNTFHSSEFSDLGALMELKEKQGVTISVGLPALNEEETIGNVITTLRQALMIDCPLVDEIVLIDSNSTDNTVQIAEALGIPVYKHPEILPELGALRGKGEALWKSLHVLRGDLICWVDTDITNIHPRFIYGLLGPLLRHPHVQYTKGFYQRPIQVGSNLHPIGGGRVTELVARPLLNLFYAELSGIIQPLSGEYAGRRAALESVPFFSGYGVETGLLIDLHERYGLDAIAQVDLEERIHYNQALTDLSKMSFAIHQVFVSRLEGRYGVQLLDKANRSMKLIIQEPERFALEIAAIGDTERPPMITVPGYQKSERQLYLKDKSA
jgi:glucosyl-3-phosphoglycerate synthase